MTWDGEVRCNVCSWSPPDHAPSCATRGRVVMRPRHGAEGGGEAMNENNPYVSSWESIAKQVAREEKADSLWFVVAPGTKVVVAIIGEPYSYESLYTDGVWRRFDPADPLHTGLVPKLRIAIACYIRGTEQVAVFEGDVAWFKQVLNVREKYGLDRWWFEFANHELSADEPCPTISVLAEETMTDEEQSHVASARAPVVSTLYESEEVKP